MLEDGNGSRLFLISCVKTKGAMPAAAMDLYTSNWFRKARACVETTGCPWRILSAQYGLIHPEEEIEPYEKTLNTMRVEERRAWAGRVLAALVPCLDILETSWQGGEAAWARPDRCQGAVAPRADGDGTRSASQSAISVPCRFCG